MAGKSRCGDVTLEVNGDSVTSPITQKGAAFRARVPLAPGANEITASCRSGGGRHESAPLIHHERLRAKPAAQISVSVRGDVVTFDGRKSRPTQPGGTRVTRYLWTRDPRHPARLTKPSGKHFEKAAGPRLSLRSPARDGEYYVSLEVADARGRKDKSTTYFAVKDGRAERVDMMHEHPSWIDRAVIYAPIPDLWGKGGPKAVERRLPYLKKLGVDALWLWPPTQQRAYGEEYAITDYFKIDPSWGPKSAFKEMVDEAHRLGLHVLVDIVPNHMSDQSPYFKDAKRYGRASSYWTFFDRNKKGKPTHYFDWTNLPNLNYGNPEVRSMIIEAFSHWVRDLDVDGFRVDAAWGVKRRRPDFWPEWRRELKRINPDLLLLAEASAVDPYYFSHGFDVGYDWSSQPGQWAWASAWQFTEEAGALLAPALTHSDKGYPPDAIVMRFLNNNDTGIRFVDQYGPELTRVAATLQFTVPGIPEMFAGDEIGASYQPYSVLTRIPWTDRFGLKPFYEKLIRLKHEMPALNSHDMTLVPVNFNSALAYVRPGVAGGKAILVLLNFGSKGRLEMKLSPSLERVVGPTDGAMRDLLSGKRVRLTVEGRSVAIPMDAQSYRVLVPEGD